MAVYKIFPTKDTTVFSADVDKNAGIDEILELNTSYDDLTPDVTRALIQFDTDEITSAMALAGTESISATLRVYLANAEGIAGETTVEALPVSGTWTMGTGRSANVPYTTNGCSWNFAGTSGSNAWSTPGVDTESGYTVSQSFGVYDSKDIEMNITNIVNAWSASTIANNGVLLKQADAQEFVADRNYITTLQYFSRDTHTIYPPTLEISWDDSVYLITRPTEVSDSRIVITMDNNKDEFHKDEVFRFRLNVREQFPSRVYQTSSLYTTNKTLPEGSTYAVKDLDTNEYVIDFSDTATRISADATGNYFPIYMNGLEPERYYKILIKTEIDGSTMVFDNDYYFKIVNG